MAAAAALAVLTASCSSNTKPTNPRIAILPVENLTGDPSFDWLTTAASTIIAGETRASSGSTIFPAPAMRDAYSSNAGLVVHANFTKATGKSLRFSFAVEDLTTHQMVQTLETEGSALQGLDQFAHQLDPAASAFSTSNLEALEAWGSSDFAKAVEIDPGFGQAWLAQVRKLALGGNTAEAEGVAVRALAQKSLHTDFERQEIAAALAELKKDYRARAQALEALAKLVPRDTGAQIAAAEAYTVARNYDASSALYKKVLAAEPGNIAALNSLGYSEALAGRLDSPEQAFENYGKLPGQAVNALDSLGEAYFLNGKFREAQEYFEQAYKQDPKFLDGRTLVKAAYAHWLGGDILGADQIFEGYASKRRESQGPLVDALWLYGTGRADQAKARLNASAANPLSGRELALWNAAEAESRTVPPPERIAQLKAAYESTMPPKDAIARTFYAYALAAAGRNDEARLLLQQWPLPMFEDPAAETLLYPRFLAARRKVGLSTLPE